VPLVSVIIGGRRTGGGCGLCQRQTVSPCWKTFRYSVDLARGLSAVDLGKTPKRCAEAPSVAAWTAQRFETARLRPDIPGPKPLNDRIIPEPVAARQIVDPKAAIARYASAITRCWRLSRQRRQALVADRAKKSSASGPRDWRRNSTPPRRALRHQAIRKPCVTSVRTRQTAQPVHPRRAGLR